MERTIVNMDMDTFFVSCERRNHSELKNMPLVIGGSSDRALVASCSIEAKKYGVRPGMPMRQAKYLCGDAKIITPDMELYAQCSDEITQFLEEKSPVLERVSIDEYFIDVSGMDKYIGCYKWTNELVEKLYKESRLPISFGLSTNKTVSKIATGEGKPHGKLFIPPVDVQPFLNPLSIRKIPGIGHEKYEELARSGIHIIESLAKTDVEILHKMYGKEGIKIWDKANGVDNAPVEPYKATKSISRSKTFDHDTIDINKIKSLLSSQIEELAYELRKNKWLASIMTIKIKYTNFDTLSKQHRIPYTSLDSQLKSIADELFDKLYDRRMRIRLIGISLSGLINSHYQIDLFSDQEETISLFNAIDRLRKRFGFKAVMSAQTLSWFNSKTK
jgi:DNA polymerase-4